jgi:hypothetical protein
MKESIRLLLLFHQLHGSLLNQILQITGVLFHDRQHVVKYVGLSKKFNRNIMLISLHL